jgi:hypothetical protein
LGASSDFSGGGRGGCCGVGAESLLRIKLLSMIL